jgi:hypothetical protein
MLTEQEVTSELRDMVALLELTGTIFRANHSSNIIPLEARFPHNKQQLLETLDTMLASGRLDRNTPGHMPMWL